MSVRSQAPANAGAGRGMYLDRVSGTSGLEADVDGLFSVCENEKIRSELPNDTKKTFILTSETVNRLTFIMFIGSRDFTSGGKVLAGLIAV